MGRQRGRSQHHLQVTDLQRATFAAGEVRAVVGTRARQVSVRTPDPGSSTATDHLGTAWNVTKARLGKGLWKLPAQWAAAGLAC